MPALRARLARLVDPSQFDLTPTGPGAVADVGCGSKKFPGAFGIDISSDTDADLVHDLDAYPYPVEPNSFDQILMQDVIEHIAEPYKLMAELHRIARPGARIQLRTPHFSSALAYGDPTHRHFFSSMAIRSLGTPGFAHYSEVRFETVHVTLDQWAPFRIAGLSQLANRYQDRYETYFAFRFPTMNIRAEFEVRK
ncbi:MAG TPA: methyltransferase domain-containing protein [Baekduia sp.]|nr:methyltransferase domain-containing protein [Baekduia sp.]